MNLYYKQLIPKEIIDSMRLDRFDISITLDSAAAQGIWPRVRVEINGQIVFDDCVIQQKDVIYSLQRITDKVSVKIHYYGKTQNHTVVRNGLIVEDQQVTIKKILVNDINIVEKNIVYDCGCFHYDGQTSHTLDLYTNGYWQLDFDLPIYNFFTKIKGHRESWEKWPDPELLADLLTTLQRISAKKNL